MRQRNHDAARRRTILGLAILCLAIAPGCTVVRHNGTEIPVAIASSWERHVVLIPQEEELPERVRREIEAFRNAVNRVSATVGDRWFGQISWDGRAFILLAREADAGGIVVWPEWREPERMLRFDGTRGRLVSSRHAILAKLSGAAPYVVVDLAGTGAEYPCPSLKAWGFRERTRPLFDVGENGRWARVDADGRLFVGQLGRDDAMAGGREIELDAPARGVSWVCDGGVLVIGLEDDRLATVVARDGTVRYVARGRLVANPSGQIVRARTRIVVARATSGFYVGEISAHGELTEVLNGSSSDLIDAISPSGRYMAIFDSTWEPLLGPVSHIESIDPRFRAVPPVLNARTRWLAADAEDAGGVPK